MTQYMFVIDLCTKSMMTITSELIHGTSPNLTILEIFSVDVYYAKTWLLWCIDFRVQIVFRHIF